MEKKYYVTIFNKFATFAESSRNFSHLLQLWDESYNSMTIATTTATSLRPMTLNSIFNHWLCHYKGFQGLLHVLQTSPYMDPQ